MGRAFKTLGHPGLTQEREEKGEAKTNRRKLNRREQKILMGWG
jgi:hypothetical protein